jgi:hypothetical protein
MMRVGDPGRDAPHVLTITDPGDGLEKEWDVEHPDTCARACLWSPLMLNFVRDCNALSQDRRLVEGDHVCYVAHVIEAIGLDTLNVDSLEGDAHLDPEWAPASPYEADWHRLRPGRYLIEGWWTPFYWAGSEPIDADGGLTLIALAPEPA